MESSLPWVLGVICIFVATYGVLYFFFGVGYINSTQSVTSLFSKKEYKKTLASLGIVCGLTVVIFFGLNVVLHSLEHEPVLIISEPSAAATSVEETFENFIAPVFLGLSTPRETTASSAGTTTGETESQPTHFTAVIDSQQIDVLFGNMQAEEYSLPQIRRIAENDTYNAVGWAECQYALLSVTPSWCETVKTDGTFTVTIEIANAPRSQESPVAVNSGGVILVSVTR